LQRCAEDYTRNHGWFQKNHVVQPLRDLDIRFTAKLDA